MVVPLRSLTWKTSAPAGVAVSPANPSSPTSPARAANLPHPEKLSRFRVRVIVDLPRLDDLRSNPHDSTPWAPPRPALTGGVQAGLPLPPFLPLGYGPQS